MYKIQEKGKPETAIWLVKLETTIGSESEADIAVSGLSSNLVAAKILSDNNELFVAGIAKNTNGLAILLNGKTVTHKTALQHDDTLVVGSTCFEIISPKRAMAKLTFEPDIPRDPRVWQLQSVDKNLGRQVFRLGPHTILGRDANCSICIPDSHLSRRHAELIVTGGKVLMKDLDSSNGSFVNNKRCMEAILNDGDEIRFDILNFKLVAPVNTSIGFTPREIERNNANVVVDKVVPPATNSITIENTNDITKSWKTRPTSIGNRENDSIDVLLEKHNKAKRISRAIFVVVSIGLCALALVILR
ncbi:Glycogen accumulation regulator GarA [BD1-7 clade bacterium]|uniref:Glycogen accumulation regulator GarA n=1 Tax=BD1-7 clade bacterium TaxID=2029982 RepID=A0A5S9QMK2_9GAMM|nr:Glycogen accumulation regulator GarA [BD1-7 clade bacterium]